VHVALTLGPWCAADIVECVITGGSASAGVGAGAGAAAVTHPCAAGSAGADSAMDDVALREMFSACACAADRVPLTHAQLGQLVDTLAPLASADAPYVHVFLEMFVAFFF
jgi:hypothetical protein